MKAFGSIGSEHELRAFLAVLFTDREIEHAGSRWKALQTSLRGLSQRDVAERLGVGIGTASHAAKILKIARHRATVERIVARTKKNKN